MRIFEEIIIILLNMGNTCSNKRIDVVPYPLEFDKEDIIPVKGNTWRYECPDGSIYIGEFKKNAFNGLGILTFTDGSVYEGKFENNYRHGHGCLNFSNGTKYEGNFEFDDMNGRGRLTFEDGSYYIGDFKIGQLVGQGCYYSCDNVLIYAGEWKDYLYHGIGMCYRDTGESWCLGNFANGKLNGIGLIFEKNGTIQSSGNYVNGCLQKSYSVNIEGFNINPDNIPFIFRTQEEINETINKTQILKIPEKNIYNEQENPNINICNIPNPMIVPPPPVPSRFNDYSVCSHENMYPMYPQTVVATAPPM